MLFAPLALQHGRVDELTELLASSWGILELKASTRCSTDAGYHVHQSRRFGAVHCLSAGVFFSMVAC